MIPPPRESGFTTTTDVPLYWARYGPAGASPLLVLHGGPGAHHDYLLPQMLELARRSRAGLLRSARRRPVEDRRSHADHLAHARRRSGPRRRRAATRPADDRRLFVGRAARDAVRHRGRGRTRTRHRPSRLVLIDPAPVNARVSARVRDGVRAATDRARRSRRCARSWRRPAFASATPRRTGSASSS